MNLLERRRAAEHVYFIKPVGADGPIKIGYSAQPAERLALYLAWSPVPLEMITTTSGGRELEGRFHAAFMSDHLHHEWFAASDRLSATIEAVKAGTFDTSTLPELRSLRCGWRPSRESIEAGLMVRRLTALDKQGVEIPSDVAWAANTYGLPPERVAACRKKVRDFVLALDGAA